MCLYGSQRQILQLISIKTYTPCAVFETNLYQSCYENKFARIVLACLANNKWIKTGGPCDLI